MRILSLMLFAVGLAGCATTTPEMLAAQDLCAEVESGRSSDEILQACTKVIEESGDRRQIALAHNRRGALHRQAGRHEEALNDYQQAVRLEPYFSGAYNNRGNVYSAAGDNARAEQSFLAALRADPKNPKAYNNYAWHLATLWRYDAALKQVREALALQRDSEVIYDTEAHVLMGLGETAKAEAAFNKAIELGGQDAVARYQKSLIAKGYEPGRSDGVMDEATRQALAACVRENCRLLLD